MLLSTCCSRRLFALPLASPSGPKRAITAITLFLFTVLGATESHATSTWTTLDHSSATVTATYLRGIDGTNIVGWYEDSSGNRHGTLYDGSNSQVDVDYYNTAPVFFDIEPELVLCTACQLPDTVFDHNLFGGSLPLPVTLDRIWPTAATQKQQGKGTCQQASEGT